ncbi:hypothetical protein FJZ31_35040 [Candidatus Poribacteria bacterium]|nr:hypothetical protein [Candidatus Poribacteria bacterium]
MLKNEGINKTSVWRIAVVIATTFFLKAEAAFTAQELAVGFIEGRGTDAAVEQQAFETAEVEYEVIGESDYKLAHLMEFDVIAVGVVAYDQNEGLKANFRVIKEYIQKGGYLVTVDFQQDSTWDANFLPYPLKLFDDDLEEGTGIKIIDAPIWHKPNEINDKHFIGWGAGDFMADGPHEAKKPWQPLLLAGGDNWPIVVGAGAGLGYVVFSSLQILQALGRTGNEVVAEVLQNFLFWHGPLAVKAEGKMATTWAKLKR